MSNKKYIDIELKTLPCLENTKQKKILGQCFIYAS